jgi:alpha-L-arabinofuranosidase
MNNQALRFPGGSLADDYHWASNTTDTNTWS